MDADLHVEEQQQKKGRHRKKQLYSSIMHQMEFYFSDSNLSKDRFMSSLIETDPFIDVNVFLKFNKIRKLTGNIEDIIKSLSKSEILELSDDKKKVKRRTPIQIKENVDECTIYVENIKSDATHEWLSSVFSEFGNIAYVSIPKYKNNNLNKGFAFVEFENEADTEKVLKFFEDIDCKMPSHMAPENLVSIATFETKDETTIVGEVEKASNKRKSRGSSGDEEIEENDKKKLKTDLEEAAPVEKVENNETDDLDDKKKKKSKKLQKRKAYFREIGLQILSKKEWKKMRNRYLNMQREKMKELKAHLNKKRFASGHQQAKTVPADAEKKTSKTIEFVPGVIVKIKLPEPSFDSKQLKAEIKTYAADVKYIDVPVTPNSDLAYLRFAEDTSAKTFCATEFKAEKEILSGDEEKEYWEKIRNDFDVKTNKEKKKQRGRDKLLKRAEREIGKHIKFDDAE